jgi:hypothetical protein
LGAISNRKYKDSVIVDLYRERENLAELCSSFSKESFKPEDIKVFTLKNVLFNGIVNDFACTAKDKFFKFYAHQSSDCGNLPLRELSYAGREYETYANLQTQRVYGSATIMLPRPEFICLYNGPKDLPDYSEVFLADAFKGEKEDAPSLNLKVQIYNINHGHNKPLMSKCPTLEGYSIFTAKVK